MRQLARWYDVEVKYEGAVTHQDFTGRIDRTFNACTGIKNTGANKSAFQNRGRQTNCDFTLTHPYQSYITSVKKDYPKKNRKRL